MPLMGRADKSAAASLRCFRFLDGPLVECVVESGGDTTAISGHAPSLMSGVGAFAYGGDGSVASVAASVEAWGGLHPWGSGRGGNPVKRRQESPLTHAFLAVPLTAETL